MDGVEIRDEVNPESVFSETTSEEVISEPILEESVSQPVVEEVLSEVAPQEAESEVVASVENNEFLSDIPQAELENQNIYENQQPEVVEDNIEIQPEEQSQIDERSEMVNNTVASEMDDVNVEAPEINITAPVKLSDMSSSQVESNQSEAEGQVQSTLSF